MMSSSDPIGIGVLGTGLSSRAHGHAYRTLAHMTDPPVRPALARVAAGSEANAAAAAARLGFRAHTTDWRALIDDPGVAVLDNCGPNDLHAEPTIAAARAGKHVICEKPLGRDAAEARAMWQQVEAAGVRHMCAFNYRFVPAIRLARSLIEEGRLGEFLRIRASYDQDWLLAPDVTMTWRLRRDQAGLGTLGDLGSHLVDLCRYLIGEPTAVMGILRTPAPRVQGEAVDVDGAFDAVVEFANGGLGTLGASRCHPGKKNSLTLEIAGTAGSLAFDLERMNELHLYAATGPRTSRGFRTILVTEQDHPWLASWWPAGHVLGWEHAIVHQLHHFLGAVVESTPVGPDGATFEDGYRAAVVCDAIARSHHTGERLAIAYEA